MEEIINSVMQSPENTNPNVLRSQLQKIDGASSGLTRDFLISANSEGDTVVLDKTYKEIYSAISRKDFIIANIHIDSQNGGSADILTNTVLCARMAEHADSASIYAIQIGDFQFGAQSEDEYPIKTLY